jgi:hypothetical protein
MLKWDAMDVTGLFVSALIEMSVRMSGCQDVRMALAKCSWPR